MVRAMSSPPKKASTVIRKGRTITETGHLGGMLGERPPSLVLWLGPFQLASSRYAAQQSSCPRTLVLATQPLASTEELASSGKTT